MSVKYLTPTSVQITSEFKTFALGRDKSDPGYTDGSVFTMTFDVDPEAAKADPGGVRKAVFAQKKVLDIMALNSERMKGVVPDDAYNARLAAIRKNYAAILDEEGEK